MNLAAWHGYQEVVLEREVDPAVVDFDFLLPKGASFLVFSFNRSDGDYTAIRVGRNKRHPAALLEVSAGGGFTDKLPLRRLKSVALGEWQTLRVEFGNDEISASLNGKPLRGLAGREISLIRPQRIGFRAGSEPAFVDNIRIVSRDGAEFVETFSRPRHWLVVCLLAVGGTLALGLGAFLLLRAAGSFNERRALFGFLLATAVLIVVAVLLLPLVSYKKGFYPNSSEKLKRQEAYWKDAGAETLFADVAASYSSVPDAGVHRFIVLGASQTAGAGAPSEEKTWVRRAERELNQRSAGPRYEWINGAVRGYILKEMVRDFENRWSLWNPTTLLVNASHNDQSAPERFERDLTRLVERARSLGIGVVLIQEPNADPRRMRALERNHAIMAEMGDRYEVPVLDLHSPLADRIDEGFLWWDRVHLTGFGQKLFAEELVEQLAARGIVTLEPR